MNEKSIGKAFSQMRVKALKVEGLSGPQIAAELNIKIRTIYQDFAILKKGIEDEAHQDEIK